MQASLPPRPRQASRELEILQQLRSIADRLSAIEAKLVEDDNELVDSKEGSEVSGKSANALRIMVHEGKLNVVKRGRRNYYRRGDLKKLRGTAGDTY